MEVGDVAKWWNAWDGAHFVVSSLKSVMFLSDFTLLPFHELVVKLVPVVILYAATVYDGFTVYRQHYCTVQYIDRCMAFGSGGYCIFLAT